MNKVLQIYKKCRLTFANVSQNKTILSLRINELKHGSKQIISAYFSLMDIVLIILAPPTSAFAVRY